MKYIKLILYHISWQLTAILLLVVLIPITPYIMFKVASEMAEDAGRIEDFFPWKVDPRDFR